MPKGKVKLKSPQERENLTEKQSNMTSTSKQETVPEPQIETHSSLNMLKTLEPNQIKHLLRNIPRGKPKSGRVWKARRTNRYSHIKKDKPLKSTWANKVQERQSKKALKLYERQLKDQRSKELEMKRKRTEENQKRKLENQRKSEVVQPIKNTSKMRRMKKKQLRKLEKR